MTQPYPPRHQQPHPAYRHPQYGGHQQTRPGGGYPPQQPGPYTRPENMQRRAPQPDRHVPAQRRTAAATPPPAPSPRNGLGIAAVIVAPIGILFGLIPLTGFVAVICGLVAIPLALAGYSRYKKGHATNGKTAVTGLVIGAVAVALGSWGISIVFTTLDELAGPSPISTSTGGAPDAPGQAGSGAAAAAAFGQRVGFDDGVAVEVSTPQAFRPGRYAAGNDRDRAVSVEVTIINGTDQPIDAVAVMVRASHGGREAPQIFDSEKGMNGAVSGTILPGKSITFPVAFSIGKDPADLQVDVNPNFMGDPAIFTGQT